MRIIFKRWYHIYFITNALIIIDIQISVNIFGVSNNNSIHFDYFDLYIFVCNLNKFSLLNTISQIIHGNNAINDDHNDIKW